MIPTANNKPIEPRTGFTSPKTDSVKLGSTSGRTSIDGPFALLPFSRTTSIHCKPSFSGPQSTRIVPTDPSATSTFAFRRTDVVPSARMTETVAEVEPSSVPVFLTNICTAVVSPSFTFKREY